MSNRLALEVVVAGHRRKPDPHVGICAEEFRKLGCSHFAAKLGPDAITRCPDCDCGATRLVASAITPIACSISRA